MDKALYVASLAELEGTRWSLALKSFQCGRRGGESIGRIHHFQHMLSIVKDMGRKGLKILKKEKLCALLGLQPRRILQKRRCPKFPDECIEFHRRPLAGGRSVLGWGWREAALQMEKMAWSWGRLGCVQEGTYIPGDGIWRKYSQLVTHYKFRDPKVYLSLT